VRASELIRFELAEAVLALAAPVVAFALYRARARLLTEPLFGAVIWLSCTELLSVALDTPLSKGRLVQAGLPIVAVGGIVAAGAAGKLHVILGGLLRGGVVALALAASGFTLNVLGLLELPGAFVFRSAHPIFPALPRMTGTFGTHAVWLGEYCILLLAVALGAGKEAGSRLLRGGTALAAASALLLSFSFAWLGGLVLAAAALLRHLSPARSVRRIVWLGVAVVYLAACWLVLVGMPLETRVEAPRPCGELDRLHHVTRPTGPGRCAPVLSAVPYWHRVTLYALAHATALESFARNPLLGSSRRRYPELATERARSVYGIENHGFYTEPIGLIAGSLARGATGAGGLLLVLWGVWRARPCEPGSPRRDAWAFYGTVALLLTATNSDFALRGTLWVAVGWLIARIRNAPSKLYTA
jgi:hypothetical protein